MAFRSLTTIQGNQMGFFIASDFSPMGIGHRFTRQGSFKAFFDKTFLELLDFFGGHFIRRSNIGICPTTGSIGLESNIGVDNRTSLRFVL